MMKTTLNSLTKRASKLENAINQAQNLPVAMLPIMQSPDEWNTLAAPMQMILKDNVKKAGAPDYRNLKRPSLTALR